MILCEVGGIGIWYFVDCQGQEEKEALALCRKHLSKEAAKDVFVLTYDRMRRYEGAWHMEKRLVFSQQSLFLFSLLYRIINTAISVYAPLSDSSS